MQGNLNSANLRLLCQKNFMNIKLKDLSSDLETETEL
jgi:hypothetical protein